MGEMADYYIDLGLNNGEGFAPRYRERSGYRGPRYSADLPKPPACNRCGTKKVFWTKTSQGHRLMDTKTNLQHKCATSAEGFEDEPV